MKNHYQTLGLEEGASREDIQAAYERLSKELNPSDNDHQDFFVEEYDKVQQAYRALNQSSILVTPSTFNEGHVNPNKQQIESDQKPKEGSININISTEKIEELKRKSQARNSSSKDVQIDPKASDKEKFKNNPKYKSIKITNIVLIISLCFIEMAYAQSQGMRFNIAPSLITFFISRALIRRVFLKSPDMELKVLITIGIWLAVLAIKAIISTAIMSMIS